MLADESLRLGEELTDLVRRGLIAFVAVLRVRCCSPCRRRAPWPTVMASAAWPSPAPRSRSTSPRHPRQPPHRRGLGIGLGILVQNAVVVVDRFRGVADTGAARADAGRRIVPAVLGSTSPPPWC
ncbi:MAG: hypothetical protein IPF77_15830 [Gemmatimonadetes bacterium]|nr:hypothetical protein [Gemmatimonadota bacterium]